MSEPKEDEESKPKNTKNRRKRLNGFEEWGGYMAAKKSKLEAQFQGRKPLELQNEQESSLFKGVSIFVNGYTNPPAEELKRLMLIHGGTYHFYYSHSRTTHIIASNLPSVKIKNLKKETVVTVQWITDSIKAGKLLPTHKYLLYSPETKDKQNKLNFQRVDHDSTTHQPSTSAVSDSKIDSTSDATATKYSSSEFENSPPCFDDSDSDLNDGVEQENDSELLLDKDNDKLSKLPSPIMTKAAPLPKKESAVNTAHPEFLSEFYNHSRLHHISTSKEELKRYVQYLAENRKDFPGKEKLKSSISEPVSSTEDDLFPNVSQKSQANVIHKSVIMHLDMDCFFVSVGLRKHPELKGQPVAVAHSKGIKGGPQEGSNIHYEASHYQNKSEKKVNGLIAAEDQEDFAVEKVKIPIHSKEYGSLSEIASCNYEARKAGVRNGMFLGEALRRCPTLKTIPYDFESYSTVSKQLYDIVSSYTMEIEAISVDELFIECTELLNETGASPHQFASTLRAEIFKKTQCCASAGLGSNMLLARLATKTAKPNGQFYILDNEIEDFMKKQKVDDLPGVGYRTSKRLKQLGIVTCGDLQNLQLSKLKQEFGPKSGETLYKKCRGKDDRTVQLQKERKSVSAEINYGIRFETNDDVQRFIKELAEEVQNRLQHINCQGKQITLKLMVRRADAPVETAKFMGHGVCDNISKSTVLKSATSSCSIIGNESYTLAQSLKIKPQDYRGVGIQVSKLESIQKEAGHQTLKNFFNNCSSSASKNQVSVQNETTSPKRLKTPSKCTPVKGTIKHFLSKPVKNLTYDLADYVPEQLDQSVLNALPEDLRKEILENCGKPTTSHVTLRPRKSPCKSLPVPSAKPIELVQNKVSSLTDNSDSEETNKPTVNTDRLPQTSLLKEKPEEQQLQRNNVALKANNLAGNASMIQKKRVIEFYITWGENNKPPTKSDPKASLGGAVEIDDVRKLLKEWIVSTQTPLEEDVEELKQFLLDSIDEDLSKVSLILKYFYRLASSHSLMWKEAYLSILSYVQQKMLQNFGAMIAASSDFPT